VTGPRRPVRGRDAAGRPVPAGSPDEVEPVPEQALPPDEAVALARSLLAEGRPFFAHDVLEAVWKVAPANERDLWQGLAQVCVGWTHVQRGNAVGAVRLLRRGAGRLEERTVRLSYGVDVEAVARQARAAADAVDAGRPAAALEL